MWQLIPHVFTHSVTSNCVVVATQFLVPNFVWTFFFFSQTGSTLHVTVEHVPKDITQARRGVHCRAGVCCLQNCVRNEQPLRQLTNCREVNNTHSAAAPGEQTLPTQHSMFS